MGHGRNLLFAGLLLAGLTGAAGAGLPEYEAARGLAFPNNSFYIRSSDKAVAALRTIWATLGDKAVAALRTNPKSPGIAIQATLHAFDPGIRAGLTHLAANLSLLTLQSGEIGTAFLIGGAGRDAHLVWRSDNFGPDTLKKFPLLSAWLPQNAREDCERRAPYGAGGRCGPVYAWGGLLPPDSRGRIRFYLDATYAQMAGMGVGAQLSIWRWDGKTAEPLLLVPYDYMIEDVATRLDGNDLHFRQKNEYKTAFVTAPEVGKQMDGTIRIDPDGVRYLGMTPTIPEFALVDDAMSASIRRKPSDAFMSKSVADELSGVFRTTFAQQKPDDFAPLGELWDSAVRRNGNGATVCWKTDATDNALVFNLVRTKAGYKIVRFAQVSSQEDFPCSHRKIPNQPAK